MVCSITKLTSNIEYVMIEYLLSIYRPVLSKVKEKSVISVPGWVTMVTPVIGETPISQMSQVISLPLQLRPNKKNSCV